MAQLMMGSGQQKKPQLGIAPPLQKTPEIFKNPTTPFDTRIPASIGNAATFAGGVAQGIVPKYTTPKVATGNTQGLSASSIGGAAQGVIPKINTTAGSNQMPANNFSKNVVGGVVPALGYGGATYGSSQQDNFAINRNKIKLENDPNYKESEIERTKKTIADRKAVGLDTSAQEKYLTVNLGYNAWSEETPIDPDVGLPPPVDYKALAEAEFAAKLAESRSRADAEKAALKGAWDTSNQTLRDNRLLDDLKFQRNNSPFEGRTNYAEGLIGRERTQQDNNSLNQFNASVSGIEQGYTDAQTEIEAQIASRAYELEQQAIAKAQAEAGITGLYMGAPTRSALESDRNFNYDAGRDAVSDSQWAQTFAEDKARYGEKVAYDKARDKIADAQDKRDFDEKVRLSGVDAAVSWYNAKTSRQNANTNSAQESRMSSEGGDGSSPTVKYDYRADPDFASEVSYINGDPTGALAEIQKNSNALIKKYGYTGYQELLKLATPKG